MHSLPEMKDCTISLSAADSHCVCSCGGRGGVVGGCDSGGGGGPPLLVMVDQAQHCTGGLSAGKRWLLTEHKSTRAQECKGLTLRSLSA